MAKKSEKRAWKSPLTFDSSVLTDAVEQFMHDTTIEAALFRNVREDGPEGPDGDTFVQAGKNLADAIKALRRAYYQAHGADHLKQAQNAGWV